MRSLRLLMKPFYRFRAHAGTTGSAVRSSSIFFGDNIAGEEFYNRLQKLQANAEKKKDTLEVYYLCLSLGFEGKYKVLNPEERSGLLEESGRKLRRAKIRISSALSPHGNRTDSGTSFRKPGVRPVSALDGRSNCRRRVPGCLPYTFNSDVDQSWKHTIHR